MGIRGTQFGSRIEDRCLDLRHTAVEDRRDTRGDLLRRRLREIGGRVGVARRSVRPTSKSRCRLWAVTNRNVIRQILAAYRAHGLPDTRTISLPHDSIVIPWADFEMFGAKAKAR